MILHTLKVLQVVTPDTVVALQVRGPVAVATDVAILVGALSMAILAAVLVRALLRVRRTVEEVRTALQRNFGPVSDRARGISDNVEFITAALRTDVARLTDSVKALTDRLHQASDRMEERIEEFNALMEVVQSEAEDIFIDTAATVRGVREGVRESTRAIGRPRRGGAHLQRQEGDAALTRPAQDGSLASEAEGDAEAEAEPTGPGTSNL